MKKVLILGLIVAICGSLVTVLWILPDDEF